MLLMLPTDTIPLYSSELLTEKLMVYSVLLKYNLIKFKYFSVKFANFMIKKKYILFFETVWK